MITGPSGVGKGTLIRALMERMPDLGLSVSATTRVPRPGEEDGVHYHFMPPEEFEKRLENGEFLEHATYAGNRYGTLRSELERLGDDAGERPRAPAPGKRRDRGALSGLVLEIEIQGARQLREAVPDALQVFIAPPSVEALRARLVGRGSDSAGEIEERLDVARRELEARSEFEHVIVNDRLERAVEELADLVDTMWSPARGPST